MNRFLPHAPLEAPKGPRSPHRTGSTRSAQSKRVLNGLVALAAAETEAPVLVNGRWNGHPLDETALREMVETYNPEAQPAPIKLTHAPDQKKAYGWVKGLRLGDWTPPGQAQPQKTLFARLSFTEEGRAAVTSGAYRMKSIEAWPRNHPSNPTPGRWNYRALALLGSESPGCPNLTPLVLAAEDDEPETPVLTLQADPIPTPGGQRSPEEEGGVMTPEQLQALQQRSAELETQNRDLLARLAAKDKDAQAGQVQSHLDDLVKGARITPAQAAILKPVLLSLPVEGVVELAEGRSASPREALFSVLEGLNPHKLLKGLGAIPEVPLELGAQDEGDAMKALVDKHKAAGKPHAEAVALAAQEFDNRKKK